MPLGWNRHWKAASSQHSPAAPSAPHHAPTSVRWAAMGHLGGTYRVMVAPPSPAGEAARARWGSALPNTPRPPSGDRNTPGKASGHGVGREETDQSSSETPSAAAPRPGCGQGTPSHRPPRPCGHLLPPVLRRAGAVGLSGRASGRRIVLPRGGGRGGGGSESRGRREAGGQGGGTKWRFSSRRPFFVSFRSAYFVTFFFLFLFLRKQQPKGSDPR